jgi:hypothetical protein
MPRKTKQQRKLNKRERVKNEAKNFERSVNKLLAKYNPETIEKIEGLSDFYPSDKIEQMFRNYQLLMKDHYNQEVQPTKITDIEVGEIDPRQKI